MYSIPVDLKKFGQYGALLHMLFPIIRQKKKNIYICVFQVSRPYLGFWPDPKHFIVLTNYILNKNNKKKKQKKKNKTKTNALWSQNIRLDFVHAGPFLFRYII